MCGQMQKVYSSCDRYVGTDIIGRQLTPFCHELLRRLSLLVNEGDVVLLGERGRLGRSRKSYKPIFLILQYRLNIQTSRVVTRVTERLQRILIK